MTLKFATAKFLKAGLVETPTPNMPARFHTFTNPANGRRVEVLMADDVRVSSLRVLSKGMEDDAQSDYFPGTWCNTVPHAIRACLS